jgi:hypothetical protein
VQPTLLDLRQVSDDSRFHLRVASEQVAQLVKKAFVRDI